MDVLTRKRTLLSAVFTALVAAFLQGHGVAGDAYPFDYSNGPYGPENWGNLYKSCAGKYQSPINIDHHDVLRVKFPSLIFHGFDDDLDDMVVVNNGHTVMLTPTEDDANKIKVEGGPLKGKYVFAQMHFHWGSNDTSGSEDSINNQSFPMELHMVFWKESYGTYKKALEHTNGLTVLGYFYEIVSPPNHAYKHLINNLHHLERNDSKISLSLPPLNDLLPEDRIHYFSYLGSLTTPPCNEIVTWIDFIDSIPLSHSQVEKFRNLMDQNHRPTQPIGDRTIYFNLGPGEKLSYRQASDSAGLHQSTIFTYLFIIMLGLFYHHS